MLICSRHLIGDATIQSASNPNKTYVVSVKPDGAGAATCTCPNYAIQRNKLKKQGRDDLASTYQCKHIKGLLQTQGCDWTENNPLTAKFSTVCPKCYAPTETYHPTPDDPTEEELDQAVQSIQAWRAKLLRARTPKQNATT